ncbi:glycine oxidase ThiO [Thalassoglobus sp. JC818]|uniref:glycine oxidase ThiO n=1 Tax=Thalassoglobus sp. JC818 TaxID=3232136 RepID=UPI00345B2D42
MTDVVIVGGGVIGLTAAYELARRGMSVSVLEKNRVGQEASWAGAGMLPPGQIHGPQEIRELVRLSASLWPKLSQDLSERTGLDNGYRNSGSLQISLDDEQELLNQKQLWENENVPVEGLKGSELSEYAPGLSNRLTCGFALPTMSQVRNPRHVKALQAACLSAGVTIQENCSVDQIDSSGNQIEAVRAQGSVYSADQFLITTGAWTTQLLESVSVNFEVEPVRGQIVLLMTSPGTITHIVEDGRRYIVPRDDGHVLIGSTMEDVGFVKQTTEEGVASLMDFATSLFPGLKQAKFVQSWAGLRPRAVRGFPAIGAIDTFENLFVAAGHFRDGLCQSTATAVLISDLIEGVQPTIPVELFRPPVAVPPRL